MAADGSVVFSVSADDADAQKKLAQLRRDIEKTAKSLGENQSKRNVIVEQLEEARAAVEKTKQEISTLMAERGETKNAILGMEENGEKGSDDYIAAQQVLKEQTYQIQQQVKLRTRQEAIVAKLEGQEQNLSNAIATQTGQMETMQGDAGEIEASFARSANNNLPKLGDAVNQVTKSIKKSARNILRWGFGIRSAFILIRRLRSALKEGIQTFAESDAETKANIDGLKKSLTNLKAAWGAAFAPIVNAVTPILQKLIDLLIKAANYIQMFFAVLNGGGTYKRLIENNEALEDSYNGAGGAADAAKKSVMGFDELNKLDDKSGGGGAGSGSNANFEEAEIDATFANIITKIKENLALLELALGGFLLGLGAILTFTGANIPLGLGMMVAGALLIARSIKEDWGAVNAKVAGAIAELMVILGMALFAIGAIIAFSGANIGLGIGMMIAGATMVTAVALNWNNLPDEVQKTIKTLMIALGGALLVIGAILAFSGVAIPLGIALMAAGGLALGYGLAHVDWDGLRSKIQNVKDKIAAIMDKLRDKWQQMIDKATEMKNKVVERFDAIRDGIRDRVESIKNKISEIIEKIKELFSFQWQLPHIRLPHLTVTWEPAGDVGRFFGFSAIPHLGVQWYAKGGVVDGATLIGAGEAGKEAIVPLERNMQWVKTVADGIVDALLGNNRFADAITGAMIPALASGQIVPPRALANGGSVFSDGDIDRLVNGIVSAFDAGGGFENVTKLYLDGREIAESVTKHQRQMARGRT